MADINLDNIEDNIYISDWDPKSDWGPNYKITKDEILNLLENNGLNNASAYFERCDEITVWKTSTRNKINKNKSDIKDKLINLMEYVIKFYINNLKYLSKHPNYSTYIKAKENEFRGHYEINITIDNFLDDENIKGYENDFKNKINEFKPELTNKIAEINNLIDELETLCKISTELYQKNKKNKRNKKKDYVLAKPFNPYDPVTAFLGGKKILYKKQKQTKNKKQSGSKKSRKHRKSRRYHKR